MHFAKLIQIKRILRFRKENKPGECFGLEFNQSYSELIRKIFYILCTIKN